MQVQSPFNVIPAVPSSYTALIPGPFILLLLFPSIPLLLFSIGARPPDTSALPFSATEVFTTAAFVSVAGGVVLGLVVWPELGKDLGGWVGGSARADGGERSAGFWGRVRGLAGRGGSGQAGRGGGTYIAQNADGTGQAQFQQIVDTAKHTAVKAVPKTQAGRAAARLYAIRSTFVHLYNPSRPHMPTAIFITCLLLAVLVVIAGNFLRAIYELDGPSSSSSSSSSSRSSSSRPDKGKDGSDLTPWVMSEIKKRQSELKAGKTPAQTLDRFQKEAEGERKQMKDKVEHLGADKGKEYRERKEEERAKELGMLKERLEKLGLTTVGVEGAGMVNAKKEGGSSGKDEAEEGDNEGDEAGSASGDNSASGKKWKLWSKRPKKEETGKKESVPISERLKRAIVPVPLSSVNETNGLTKASAKRDLELLMSGGTVPARGPGWEIADNAEASAALAKSASNAETLAARMKA